MLWIATNPPVVQRLRDELEAAGVDRDRPTTDVISNAKARSIKYLLALAREALRMHPPVVGGLEKQLSGEDEVLPDGRRIPAGTYLNVSTWAILRDPDTFGPDAEYFRPERWLEDLPDDRRRQMDRAHELVFSAGRFICMGRDIAMTQMLKVITEVRHRPLSSSLVRSVTYAMNPPPPCSSFAASTSLSRTRRSLGTAWRTESSVSMSSGCG